MKKLFIGLLSVMLVFSLSGCGTKNENVEGTLDEIMDKVYDGISQENLPMMLGRIEVSADNAMWYLGTDSIEYEEGLASESGVGSIAHSVVLLRMKDASAATKAVETLKETVDPRKWICVEADESVVESKGDLVIVILDGNGNTETFKNNFLNLK